MQSVNEELETSKEEIQSSNEELVTVNDELNTRNAELQQFTRSLRQARDYAENIVASLRSVADTFSRACSSLLKRAVTRNFSGGSRSLPSFFNGTS